MKRKAVLSVERAGPWVDGVPFAGMPHAAKCANASDDDTDVLVRMFLPDEVLDDVRWPVQSVPKYLASTQVFICGT